MSAERAERVKEALREDKIWSDENHPDLASQEDINRYLSETRASWRRPILRNERKL